MAFLQRMRCRTVLTSAHSVMLHRYLLSHRMNSSCTGMFRPSHSFSLLCLCLCLCLFLSLCLFLCLCLCEKVLPLTGCIGPLFPYGETDFASIRESNQFFVDNSRFIKELEQQAENNILLRPPRFGKSLFANMLARYYDVNTTQEQFERWFGGLDICEVYHLSLFCASVIFHSRTNSSSARKER